MAEHKEWKIGKHHVGDLVEVPSAREMDDETFIKHLEHRHADDCHLSENGTMYRDAMEAWLPSYRAYHERLHKIARPGQYDHEHELEA